MLLFQKKTSRYEKYLTKVGFWPYINGVLKAVRDPHDVGRSCV